MEVSKVVLDWQAQARAEGVAGGRAEIRTQFLAMFRRWLLRVLEVRLKVPPPQDVAAAVESQTDPATLDR